MLTTIGKAFVFFMVIMSTVAVGVAMWAFADRTQYGDLRTKLGKEIGDLYLQRDLEKQALNSLLGQIRMGDRAIPYDAEDRFANSKPKTVRETKQDITRLENEIKEIYDNWNRQQVALTVLIRDLNAMREQTREAFTEQKRLREIITPDPDKNPGARAMRDQVAAAMAAKEESERRFDSIQPVLVNEVLRLMVLMKRNELLKSRTDAMGN